jgi:iron complex outermembrane receptor protein
MIRKRVTTGVALVAMLGTGWRTGAQEAAAPLELPTIEVSGSLAGLATGPTGFVPTDSATAGKIAAPLVETPASVSVVGADEIAARGGAVNLGDAIAYTPGIWVDPAFSLTSDSAFTIRGFSSWGANYLDGLRVGTGMTRAGQPSIEPYGMERIDVLRGPASVLYGQIVPGGLVNTVSKRPTFDSSREAMLQYGSYDQLQGAFDLNGVIGDGASLAWRMVAFGQSSNTQMDEVDDNRVYLAPSLTWNIGDDTTLTLLAYWRRLRGQEWSNELVPEALETVPVSFNPGEPGFDVRDSDQYSFGYEFAHRFNDSLSLVQNARVFRMDGTYHQVFAWSGLTGNPDRPFEVAREAYKQDQTVDLFAIDTRLVGSFRTGALTHEAFLGVDYNDVHSRMTGQWGAAPPLDFADPVRGLPLGPWEAPLDDHMWQTEVGIYAQDRIAAGPWRITLGGRWTDAETGEEADVAAWNFKQDDSAFVANAGILYLTEAGFAPYASFAQSFMPEAGTDWQGTPFEPTRGQQYEVGVKYQPPGVEALVTLAAFEITQSNLTTADPEHPDFSRQTGEVRMRGLELEGRAAFGPVDASLSYTYLDSEVTESEDGTEGNDYPSTPPNVASLWLDYRPEGVRLAGLRLGGGLRYNDGNWGDDANTLWNDSQLLIDLAAGYDFGALSPDWEGLTLDVNATSLGAGDDMLCLTWGCYYVQQPTASATLTWRW